MPTGIYKRTKAHYKKIVKARKGYKHTEETKQKMSEALRGHKTSKEIRRKIGLANSISLLGKKCSKNCISIYLRR